MVLGPRVREKRKARGFSQEHLAQEAGVTWSAIQRLEAGQVNDPHYSTLLGIARALDTTVAELVGESAPKASAPPETGHSEATEGIAAARTKVDELLEEVALGFSGAHEFEKHVARMATRVHFLIHEAESALGELGDAKEYTERFGPELAERYQAYIDAVRVTTQEFDKDLRPLLLRMHADASEAERERQSPHTERTTNNG
jgi:transcriptional regulator with XRE-family HTH domain